MLARVGGVVIHGPQRHRHHPATALTYGTGLALIVDEFALLLGPAGRLLGKQGRIFVDLGVGDAAGLGGTALAAAPSLRPLLTGR